MRLFFPYNPVWKTLAGPGRRYWLRHPLRFLGFIFKVDPYALSYAARAKVAAEIKINNTPFKDFPTAAEQDRRKKTLLWMAMAFFDAERQAHARTREKLHASQERHKSASRELSRLKRGTARELAGPG